MVKTQTRSRVAKMKNQLLKMWIEYSKLVEQDQTIETIDKENELLLEIEKMMKFKNREEHEKWIDKGNSNCWEDWEEMTLKIIKRRK